MFELIITADKGYGLFATQDIKRGTRIIAEEPMLVLPSDVNTSSLYTYLDKLTPDQHAQLSDLASTKHVAPPTLKQSIRQRLQAKYSGAALDAAVEDSLKMHCTFLTNTVYMGPDVCFGMGIFLNYSHMNHSCRRNVHNSYNPTIGKETVHAIRDIKAGDELLTSYIHTGLLIKEDRQKMLAEHWGFDCRCEVCDGPDAAECEQRRERLQRIGEGLAVYERHDRILTNFAPHPVPKDDAQALAWLEESVGLLKEEGLAEHNLVHAYRQCSEYALKLGQAAKAMAYARKELEVERVCLGDETDHMEEGMEGAKFWIRHLEKMSEQEAVKDRMNQKREAKEQKKNDKKAAKKAAKGKK
ncbi:hypothetical protein M409DRAFT_23724 [Zasmidium cellare ATCC 36951]|uniref:SET domain-containing protein n=1 Tax=Zasmidium cellare ATCC 36951 TaxID=1080233 RepID=A0A6A6CFI8_ZASCE|nr:uncharacterized protein M409DRAFT_23724 [Zasmidium cellare ATCC 36951]KAF2165997.1 hypothetical protein M409DRAFT_23724 [Zasmidium cellare ATCC 36951]